MSVDQSSTRSLDYTIVTTIEKIEQRYEDYDHGLDENKKPTSKIRPTGWWLVLKGFPDAIWMGPDQPFWDTQKTTPMSVGDQMKITFSRVVN